MATSGSFYSTFGTSSAYRIVLEWKRNSTDMTNNKSNVTVTAYLQSTGSSYTINSSVTKNGSMTINGTTYNFTFSAALSGNQKKQIYTKTIDIYHNSDGTKSFSMSVSGTIGITFSSGYVNTVSTSGTATLDTIPRTSSFTLNTTNVTLGSTAVTVTINRASTSFTHKIYVVFGSNTTTYFTTATTSATFTPILSLASAIPNATSGTATIYVQTLNGSTVIGTTSKTMTYNVPSSVVPTFTSLSISLVTNGAPSSFGYISGVSKATITANGVAGSYGSTVKSLKITGAGGTWTTSNSSVTTGIIYTTGNVTFTGTVTDSRGRTSAAKTVTITVNKYSNPVISNYNAIRCTSDGTADDSGAYIKTFAQFSYTALDNNSVTAIIEYKRSDVNTWTNGGNLNSGNILIIDAQLDTSYTYNVRLTVSDAFKSTSRTIDIAPEFVTIDFKAGGSGIAIGKKATQDNFEIQMQTQINKDLIVKGGTWVHEARPNGVAGYMKIAHIDVLGVNNSVPIEFTIIERSHAVSTKIAIRFTDVTSTPATGISRIYRLGPAVVGIAETNGGYTGTSWDVYVDPTMTWDVIGVTEFNAPKYALERINITWTQEIVSSAPENIVWASDKMDGNWWQGHPVQINTDGISEVGKHLDFHATNEGTTDNDGRITCDGNYFIFGKTILPVKDNAGDLGNSNFRWRTVYSVNGYQTSDMNAKENITPIQSTTNTNGYYTINSVSLENTENATQDVSLQAMRDFIKNDCKLYKYNYKGQENQEIGFIAQDIANTPIGKDLLIETEHGYMYSIGTYLGILLGAIQQEFVTKDDENEAITQMMKSIRNS